MTIGFPCVAAGLSIMAVPALGVLFSRLRLAERPGTVELSGMMLIGASLALLWWESLRGASRSAPQAGQE